MTDNWHSTGRGGAGNISTDTSVVYADGAIIREGPANEAALGSALSTGRGGAGNVGAAVPQAADGRPPVAGDDIVPETAMREEHQANFHTGRGGGGNVHKDKYGGHSTRHEQEMEEREKGKGKEGLGEKIKGLFGGKKGEEKK